MSIVKHTHIFADDPCFYQSYGLNIHIEIRPKFTLPVQQALCKIESCEVGNRLIERINAGKHRVWINKSTCETLDDMAYPDRSGQNQKGVGAPTEIFLAAKVAKVFDITGVDYDMPIFLCLAHELIHAYHNSYGKNARGSAHYPSVDPVLWTDKEEYHTIVGFPSKKAVRTLPKITENAIRRAFGFHERFSHLGTSNNCGNLIEKCSRLIQSKCNNWILQFNPLILPTPCKKPEINIKITQLKDPFEIKYFPYMKNIFIQTNSQCPEFAESVRQILKSIETSKVIAKIVKGNKSVWINHSSKENTRSDIYLTFEEIKLMQQLDKAELAIGF